MKKQHPYQIEIPKGYQYCPECGLITPHTLDSQINPSKSMPEDFTCDICYHTKDGYSLCPYCGWEHDPDNDIAPETIKVKRHTEACLQNQRKEWDKKVYPEADFFIDDDHCDCPEVDTYPVQHIYNYNTWTPSHLDCYHAKEWSYDIMCKVCNYVFEVEDGNC